tara:strand:- start:351 stop:482 length:132 start_codon:yes stop_codon:yes gene_type:complete
MLSEDFIGNDLIFLAIGDNIFADMYYQNFFLIVSNLWKKKIKQ